MAITFLLTTYNKITCTIFLALQLLTSSGSKNLLSQQSQGCLLLCMTNGQSQTILLHSEFNFSNKFILPWGEGIKTTI
jgi:hypothetical protein